eukprot:7979787-Pyramimonas_sp.AAC.1
MRSPWPDSGNAIEGGRNVAEGRPVPRGGSSCLPSMPSAKCSTVKSQILPGAIIVPLECVAAITILILPDNACCEPPSISCTPSSQ